MKRKVVSPNGVVRSRPLDFEVHSVERVVGYGSGAEAKRSFLPFYAPADGAVDPERSAYFTVQREPRVLSTKQRASGPRLS